MSEDLAILAVGFLAGAIVWDVLWRFTNRLSAKLCDVQRELIAEQKAVIDFLWSKFIERGRP